MPLSSQGRHDAAEELYVRALKGKEASLRLKHCSPLKTIHCFARFLKHQQRYEKASAYYLRACERTLKTLDSNNDRTQKYISDYTSMLRKEKRKSVKSKEEGEIRLNVSDRLRKRYGNAVDIRLISSTGHTKPTKFCSNRTHNNSHQPKSEAEALDFALKKRTRQG